MAAHLSGCHEVSPRIAPSRRGGPPTGTTPPRCRVCNQPLHLLAQVDLAPLGHLDQVGLLYGCDRYPAKGCSGAEGCALVYAPKATSRFPRVVGAAPQGAETCRCGGELMPGFQLDEDHGLTRGRHARCCARCGAKHRAESRH